MLLLLLFFIAIISTVFAISKPNYLPQTNRHAVLAYATSMNMYDLLTSANQARAANGLGPLRLTQALNKSAQMKANDQIANNYWAHVSPSGVQPWYWFQQAGYSYVSAGENLAYGFNTGSEVNTAWINSPTHKDNLLGNYVDVGFGIANGPSFQGGENTVVVAHYGNPQPGYSYPEALVEKPAPPPPVPPAPQPSLTSGTPKPYSINLSSTQTANQPSSVNISYKDIIILTSALVLGSPVIIIEIRKRHKSVLREREKSKQPTEPKN